MDKLRLSTSPPWSLCAFVLFCLLVVGGAVGCGRSETAVVQPTLIPLATVPASQAGIAAGTVEAEQPAQSLILPGPLGRVSTGNDSEALPTPEAEGVRPYQAKQYWVPDAGPDVPQEWRPPPVEVPLSFHPDDHYWLERPISSGYRNYDLEWYPYGNDVLLSQYAPYRVHHGVDFPNDPGTPVLAASSGTVIHAGRLPSPRNGINYYGNTVIIRHDWQWQEKDVYTLYAHTLELFVQVGDDVEQGEVIAGVGQTGQVSGPHLHFEVRIENNNYGSTRNPALWLAPYEGWGTLAGRLVDRRGRMIPGATIKVMPLPFDPAIPVRTQRTYESSTVQSDEVWRENFVVADLPAGRYRLHATVNDVTIERVVELLPGRTHFEIMSTTFEFVPTPTPQPTATPEPEAETILESEENGE